MTGSLFSKIDKGYLLSPRDLCSLEYLPQLVKAGVSCLKIEGRMKTPEYVSTVTRIYRKYLDLAIKVISTEIDNQDKKDLLQVFNRGGFSNGHLLSNSNQDLVYKNKSNNMGIYLGTIANFNSNKGHISFTTSDTINIGDKISIENKKHETSIYTISELMINDKNIPQANNGQKVKIGRMKGEISVGDKIYKVSDKNLTATALNTLNQENRKIDLSRKMTIKKDSPISIEVSDDNGCIVNIVSDIYPVDALNSPITVERLSDQISKTNNTPYQFKNIEINLDDGLYIQGISNINELRRQALTLYEEKLINSFKRTCNNIGDLPIVSNKINENKKISVLLNIINNNFDYTNLKNIDKIYIPFKYFILKDFTKTIETITNSFDTYIYMPTIIRNNYNKLINKNLTNILNTFKIKGFVISNIGNLEALKSYSDNYEFICNYTFNIYNDLTINELPYNTITLSPELNKTDLLNFKLASNSELIVYGKTVLMNSNYCLLGKTNKCYTSCEHLCNSCINKYYLKDRLGFLFRVVPDNIDTITTIYNSKITSIEHKDLNVSAVRIDILDEDINEINNIVNVVKTGKKLEGSDFTNGNFNKEI